MKIFFKVIEGHFIFVNLDVLKAIFDFINRDVLLQSFKHS